MPRRDYLAWVLAPALLAGALALVVPWTAVLGAVLIMGSVAIAAVWPMLAWALVVLTYPFIYFQLFVGETINVPYVDVFAALTFAGVAVRCSMQRVHWNFLPLPQGGGVRGGGPLFRALPGVIPYLSFLAVGVLSLQNAEDLLSSVKYLLRPLAFFYPMFVVLPLLVVTTPQRLFSTFRILFAVGGVAAAMGLWSFIVPTDPAGLRRAVPIAIAGVAPLGTNHNLIAEVLVSVIPVGMILAAYARSERRRWYAVGTACYALVTILTFSRNGWLTLAVEAMVVGTAIAHERGFPWRVVVRTAVPLAMVTTLAIALFSFSGVARSSNANRLQLTTIALEQFRAHPWVGAGVGTFIETVRRDRWYLADFGQPQEAHGLGQKLLAETGTLGLFTFAALLAAVITRIVRVYRITGTTDGARSARVWQPILLALLCSAVGSIIFQLFNTSYFVSKLWLPLGVALAAAHLAERGIALRREDAGFR